MFRKKIPTVHTERTFIREAWQSLEEGKQLMLPGFKNTRPSVQEEKTLTATKWTVQPAILTPACSACFWAFTPLNEGSSDGWMFSSLPVELKKNKKI